MHRVARLGARLAGRNAGLVAALFVGANPLFLQYSAQAESGIAAGLCLALGLERVLERGTRRDAWIAGLWFGASFLVAYKSIAILLPLFALLIVRDRWKHRSSWLASFGGLGVAAVVQTLIDWAMYGEPGASLKLYLVTNFGSVTYSLLHRVGLTQIARPIYELVLAYQGVQFEAPPDLGAIGYKGLQGPYWYFEYLHHFLVVPVLACTVIGAVLCIVRASWKSTVLTLAFLVFAAATFNKGSKDFRLWIPLLPGLAPVGAWGFVALLSIVRSVAWRRALGVFLLAPAVALGLAMFLSLPHERFGAYWDAMDAANARARELYAAETAAARASTPPRVPEPVRIAAAYNWAVYLRQEPGVELVKLPHQLTGWPKFDDAQKGRDFAVLEELDLFVAHQPVLSQHPDLLEWTAAHFDVRELVWGHGRQTETGPLYLLERRTSSRSAARFLDVRRGVDPEHFRAKRALPPPAAFVAADGSGERIVLLGYEVRTLPPHGWSWITYHWYTPTGVTRDLTIVDRLTALDERNTWQNDHRGAWGAYPTSQWRAGEIVSEGYPLVPATTPFAADAPWRPVGGGYRRGEAVPLRLWMELVELDPVALKERGERVVTARFVPADPVTFAPRVQPEPNPASAVLESEDGLQWSGDDLVRVGAFFLSVHPLARVANDGRPLPD
ncbi:MAG: glycosyltransferase family 39 protein [Planctomycetes bacterium]|nr:glycosyltransferase family 39 protein [Planctomycetota bacterium]